MDGAFDTALIGELRGMRQRMSGLVARHSALTLQFVRNAARFRRRRTDVSGRALQLRVSVEAFFLQAGATLDALTWETRFVKSLARRERWRNPLFRIFQLRSRMTTARAQQNGKRAAPAGFMRSTLRRAAAPSALDRDRVFDFE